MPTKNPVALSARDYRKELGTPQHIVNLSRSFSVGAIKTLSDIMEDDSQPVVARIRCAEVLLERAYGRAPQAMVISSANDAAKSGIHALPILERIAQLRQAKELPATTDLEASDVQELPATEESCPDLTSSDASPI
jgi:hypothetical protein